MKTRSGFETNVKKPNLKTIWLHPKGRRPPAPRNRTTLLRHCPRRRRSSSNNNVGKTIPNLPFDIQLNIISRLSAKLIFGCKSLSKAFNAAISEPSFTRIYHNNYYSAYSSSSLNPIFINSSDLTSIHDGESEHIQLELLQFQTDVYTNHNPIISKGRCFSSATLPGSLRGDQYYDGGSSIWGQCNGLCCLLKLDYDILNLFLTNPLSGEFIKLPDPVKCDQRSWWKNIMAYGLGYCQTTQRYKVLRIVTNYLGGGVTNYDTKTEILTIGVDKKWRDVSDVNVPFNVRRNECGPNPQVDMVAFRSALHWKVRPIRMHDGFEFEPKCGGRIHIAAFDMTKERVCALPFPPEVGCIDSFGMGVLMDKLCLWDLMIQTDDINIWIMNEYGVEGSWTRQFKIKFSRLPHGFQQVQFMALSISVHNGVILISDQQRLVFYDLKTNYSLTCIHLVHKYDLSYPTPFVPDFVSFRNRQGWIADEV